MQLESSELSVGDDVAWPSLLVLVLIKCARLSFEQWPVLSRLLRGSCNALQSDFRQWSGMATQPIQQQNLRHVEASKGRCFVHMQTLIWLSDELIRGSLRQPEPPAGAACQIPGCHPSSPLMNSVGKCKDM